MKAIILLLIPLYVITTIGCTSYSDVREPQQNKKSSIILVEEHNITSWNIAFKYKNLSIETKEYEDKTIEKTTKDFGYSSFEILLIDEIYFRLKYFHKKDVKVHYENTDEAGIGKILLHPVIIHSSSYYYYYVEIIIQDENGEMIARTLVQQYAHAPNSTENIIKQCVNYILSII